MYSMRHSEEGYGDSLIIIVVLLVSNKFIRTATALFASFLITLQ